MMATLMPSLAADWWRVFEFVEDVPDGLTARWRDECRIRGRHCKRRDIEAQDAARRHACACWLQHTPNTYALWVSLDAH